MNSIERGRTFLQALRALAGQTAWEWRRCPRCGEALTHKHGSYTRHPWGFEGRRAVRVPRHWCHGCRRSYSEQSAWLVRGSWYAREVHRAAIDHWQHLGTSLRRTAEVLRSWLGRQERWQVWRPLDAAGERERCSLSASTVQRWLDRAGQAAERTVSTQLVGVPSSGHLATDGLWARLREEPRGWCCCWSTAPAGCCGRRWWSPTKRPPRRGAGSSPGPRPRAWTWRRCAG